ncbi:hypothetical protein AWB79_05262 [Caballeronia hypogeia]|uniref:Dirigent protein n=1 Tax=Caballeronia hypogeia TaxID=1777140 RepID=A0A158CF53_9BURK|nr:hypothetical protein [Caballeronia hypogeia]SAK81003.1 hypothetical protein AWB79_05262 [Caballeronia hypogeia]
MNAALAAMIFGASLSPFSSVSWAQNNVMPQQGSATYVAYYLNHVLSTMDMGEKNSGAVIEGFGITRSDNGQKPFDKLSVHCLFFEGARGGQYSETGSCTETDTDGDMIYLTVATDTQTFTGGTGKYKGISGTGTFSGHPLRPPAPGTFAVEVEHKVNWKLK